MHAPAAGKVGVLDTHSNLFRERKIHIRSPNSFRLLFKAVENVVINVEQAESEA